MSCSDMVLNPKPDHGVLYGQYRWYGLGHGQLLESHAPQLVDPQNVCLTFP